MEAATLGSGKHSKCGGWSSSVGLCDGLNSRQTCRDAGDVVEGRFSMICGRGHASHVRPMVVMLCMRIRSFGAVAPAGLSGDWRCTPGQRSADVVSSLRRSRNTSWANRTRNEAVLGGR